MSNIEQVVRHIVQVVWDIELGVSNIEQIVRHIVQVVWDTEQGVSNRTSSEAYSTSCLGYRTRSE